MIKKTLLVLLGLLIGSTLAIPYTKDRFDRLYPKAARVVDIQGEEVYLQDGAGNVWRWQGAEDWQVGDGAAMIMSNNGTKDIYDDIIVSIKYSSL
jgi:hypothetical protein